MILGSQSHGFHACMKKHDFRTSKHEKVALQGGFPMILGL